jgi:hypothetical protein
MYPPSRMEVVMAEEWLWSWTVTKVNALRYMNVPWVFQ